MFGIDSSCYRVGYRLQQFGNVQLVECLDSVGEDTTWQTRVKQGKTYPKRRIKDSFYHVIDPADS